MFSDDDALRHVQRLGEDAGDLPRLVIFTGQTSLDDAPSIYQEAIAAWRTGQVERHVLSPAEIEEMARVNTRRYRAPMTAESYPVGAHLYVPFEHGVFTLRTDRQQVDPFSDVQVSFLKRLVRTVSVGYARYREFLRLELDRTVQHMRAEVQAIGAGAVNQAVKAFVLAKGYLAEDGYTVVCVPEFVDVDIEGKIRTAIRLVVEPR